MHMFLSGDLLVCPYLHDVQEWLGLLELLIAALQGWRRVALEIPRNVRKGKIGWGVNEDVPQKNPRNLVLMG